MAVENSKIRVGYRQYNSAPEFRGSRIEKEVNELGKVILGKQENLKGVFAPFGSSVLNQKGK